MGQLIANEHRERLESELRAKTLTDELRAEIEVEANKLAQEHEARLRAEKKQDTLDEKMKGAIEKEAADIKKEHIDRITAQKIQEAFLVARIDDQHEEIRINERKRLEEQTRQRRID